MATQVTNYQCPACTAPLHFEASTGDLLCDFCGSTFTTEQIEALYAEKDAKAAAAQAEAEVKRAKAAAGAGAGDGAGAGAAGAGAEAGEGDSAEAAQAQTTVEANADWSDSSMSADWGPGAEDLRMYNCPSCGAELICDETTAATACPYCDNPTIIPGQLRGVLKPDYVIPFKLKKEDAIAALKQHYEGRPFLPDVFKNENHLQEIKGVYVPFWLFDGEARGHASYEGTRTRMYVLRDLQVVETSHFDVVREGTVSFAKIPVDASSKMDNDYMDSLEPFDYSEMQPFSTGYLPGFFADKYDESIDQCGSRADNRAASTLVDSLRSTVTGYEAVMDRGSNVQLIRGDVKYALLPVWLLNTRWNGELYRFAMNGQTGKFVGHLPTDKGKKRRTFILTYLISFVAMVAAAAAFAASSGLLGL